MTLITPHGPSRPPVQGVGSRSDAVGGLGVVLGPIPGGAGHRLLGLGRIIARCFDLHVARCLCLLALFLVTGTLVTVGASNLLLGHGLISSVVLLGILARQALSEPLRRER